MNTRAERISSRRRAPGCYNAATTWVRLQRAQRQLVRRMTLMTSSGRGRRRCQRGGRGFESHRPLEASGPSRCFGVACGDLECLLPTVGETQLCECVGYDVGV
jgi:hypothetical protein